MAEFKREQVEYFLATVRKYMQLRGVSTQKDLAEKADIGISTMSRFLAQKTTELNPMLISKLVAVLDIPVSEVIDFVEEDFSERFIRLVKFYKKDYDQLRESELDLEVTESVPIPTIERPFKDTVKEAIRPSRELDFKERFDQLTPKQKIFLSEFLALNLEEKDVIVDVGNNMLQYFKLKGMNI